jgi:hypothetical protein
VPIPRQEMNGKAAADNYRKNIPNAECFDKEFQMLTPKPARQYLSQNISLDLMIPTKIYFRHAWPRDQIKVQLKNKLPAHHQD